MVHPETLVSIREDVIRCKRCPRLRRYCEKVALREIHLRRAYVDERYWGKPVPGFGDLKAELMIVGLAPAAHGANRTGRIFTGDRSGEWLYRALHKAGFANQPTSVSRDDGLKLRDAYVCCVVRCAPPGNKPLPAEFRNCAPYLERELAAMPQLRVWVALGLIALQGIWRLIGEGRPRPRMKHGDVVEVPDARGWLIFSYHPSQQNTFTGRLTEPMFDQVFSEARKRLKS